jgi:hypothetical protein
VRIRSPERHILAKAAPGGFSALLLTKLNAASASQQRGKRRGVPVGARKLKGSGEGCALVFPEQRQVGTLEPLAGQRDGLGAIENTFDEIRCQEGDRETSPTSAPSRRAMSLMVRAPDGSR